MKVVRVSIFGFGTVGRALAEIMAERGRRFGVELRIVSITDRSGTIWGDIDPLEAKEVKETMGRLSAWDEYEVFDFSPEELVQEVRPDILVDVSSHDEAFSMYETALKEGIGVVTSNKPPIANHYRELMKAAEEGGAGLFFEATVMAGTPVIGLLRENLLGDDVLSIEAVLNASTTFILTEMERGSSFEKAVEKAKEQGILEEDPSKDIDGIDAMHKAKILHWVAFGQEAEEVEVKGIREVTDARRVRLIAEVSKGRIRVQPKRLSEGSPLLTEGVLNAAVIRTDLLGELVIKGPGGGGKVTASGVFSDILKAASYMKPLR
ncbi:homoserine dehydrogenase [Pyrococcus yayanosii]|uniref:Homoserine dehydrogenase n=1 Tax=Pyrococcus yayanosii (strain CH1 / JCM 16557) TaxID=529709 RepID=F8AGJ5_PYRYC|nr:homoserine dehydrogenase [Pyrococcus yayanosii]AEH23966.1 homoserine dehydrogenase [Pyrococcus yayanosii CH1]